MYLLVWIGSIIATAIIASNKGLSAVGFILLAIFLGPLALIIALAMNSNEQRKIASEKEFSLDTAKAELVSLKASFSSLQQRLKRLEKKLSLPDAKDKTLAKTPKTKQVPAKAKESFEFVFGKYWLNRIGVILVFLGVSFFIGYAFKYLGASTKVLLGYLLALLFFAWGRSLEQKEKYKKLSTGFLGLSWGLAYLATYAMYYIEATKIIHNPILELWLLAGVSFSAIIYNLRYRSWVITSFTFLLAFITVGLGDVDYSSLLYCTLLIGSIAYLSSRLKWYKFLLFGICGTYFTYIHWLQPQIIKSFLVSQEFSIPVYQFHLSFGILFSSWLLFTLALFGLKSENKENSGYLLSGVLLNAIFFTFLGLSELYKVRPHLDFSWDIRFWFLIGLAISYFLLALFYKICKYPRFIVLCVSCASLFIVMAIIVKMPLLSVGFFWIWQTLILFTLGFYYRERIYRILACLLSLAITLRLFMVDYSSYHYYEIFGINIKHNILIFSFAALIFYLLAVLAKQKRIANDLGSGERKFIRSFAIWATVLLIFLLGKEVDKKWISSAWALLGIFSLGVGFLLRDKLYRTCGLGATSLACLKLFFIDLSKINNIYKIFAFVFLGLVLLGISLFYSKAQERQS